MTGSRESRLVAIGFVVLAALLAVGAARQAEAGGGTSRAVVVVGSTPMCITFNGTITGVEALSRAGVQVTTSGFGGLGSGVCAINGQGCPASACFDCDRPNYWHYFRADSGGGYVASPVGASSTRVENGDVEAWVWGGAVGPPAPVSVADVCGPAPTTPPTVPAPTSPPKPDPGSPSTPAAPGPAETPGAGATPATPAVPGNTPLVQESGGAGAAQGQSDPPTTTTAEATSTTTMLPDETSAADESGEGARESAARANLAADPNLASAPSIDEESGGGASWTALAAVALLVGGLVAWGLWRRRVRTE